MFADQVALHFVPLCNTNKFRVCFFVQIENPHISTFIYGWRFCFFSYVQTMLSSKVHFVCGRNPSRAALCAAYSADMVTAGSCVRPIGNVSLYRSQTARLQASCWTIPQRMHRRGYRTYFYWICQTHFVCAYSRVYMFVRRPRWFLHSLYVVVCDADAFVLVVVGFTRRCGVQMQIQSSWNVSSFSNKNTAYSILQITCKYNIIWFQLRAHVDRR